MTKRQEIFETLKTDLLKIKIANGYAHDINKVIAIQKTADAINEFDAVVLFKADERVSPRNEAQNVFECSLNLIVLAHIETMSDVDSEGLFTTEAESMAEDFQNLLGNPDPAAGCTLGAIEGVDNFFISRIEPYTDTGESKQTLAITITVKYYNAE